MAEQGRSQADASGGTSSGQEGAGDVSMDEILTSLRSILEEEPKEEGQEHNDPAGSGEQDSPAEADSHPKGDQGEEPEEELLLTDVVEPGPNAPANEPDPAPGEAETPAAETEAPAEETAEPQAATPAGSPQSEDEQFDALFGQITWETEAQSEQATGAPDSAGTGTEAAPEPSGALEMEPEQPEPEELEPEEEGDALAFQQPEPEATQEPAESDEAATGEPAPDPAGAPAEPQPTAEVTEFPAASRPAPAVDSEALKGEVERTVEEQVAQATADLDSRLAEALEPKIRQALQGFLEDRLPSLLQELAEAEIERIKRGE